MKRFHVHLNHFVFIHWICYDIVGQNWSSMAYSRNELKNPDLVSDKDGLEYQWGRSWQQNGRLVTVNCGLLPWPWPGPGRTQWQTLVIAPIPAQRPRQSPHLIRAVSLDWAWRYLFGSSLNGFMQRCWCKVEQYGCSKKSKRHKAERSS